MEILSDAYLAGFNNAFKDLAVRSDRVPIKRPKKLRCKPGYVQRGAACQKKSTLKNSQPLSIKTGSKNNHLKNIFVASALALGLPVATYMGLRAKYRAGIPKSAEIAKEKSKEIKVPDISDDQDNMTFTIGGFYAGLGGKTAQKKGQDYLTYKLSTEVLDPNHFVITHRNEEFDDQEADEYATNIWTKKKPEEITVDEQINMALRAFAGHTKKVLTPVLVKGRNPEAVKLASEVYAYKQKYPNKSVNLVGHSAGGMIAHEAAEILDILGIKTKTVNLGTGYFGFTKTPEGSESYTITDRSDAYLQTLAPGSKNPVFIGNPGFDPSKHELKHYMRSEESKEALRKILNTQSKSDSLYGKKDALIKRVRPVKLKCKPGYKQRGAVCQPIKTKLSNSSSNQISSKKKKLI